MKEVLQQPVEKTAAMLMASKKPRKAEEQLADSASFKICNSCSLEPEYSFSTGCQVVKDFAKTEENTTTFISLHLKGRRVVFVNVKNVKINKIGRAHV